MEKIRSFIAVDIRGQGLLGALVRAQDMIRRTGADVKIVEPENLHVTLRFLGELFQSQIEQIADSLKGLKFKKFEIELRGLGAFPNTRYMNVVWAGITRGAEELARIAEEVEPRVREAGVPSDRKGFSPHVTIARVKSGRGREHLARVISGMADEEFGHMIIESLALKRSDLRPGGPVYSNMYEVRANEA